MSGGQRSRATRSIRGLGHLRVLPLYSTWRGRICLLVLVALVSTLFLALPGCGGGGEASAAPVDAAAAKKKSSKSKIKKTEATGAKFSLPKDVEVPTIAVLGDPTIDTSGINDGYVFAAAKSSSRLKFQVKCGEMTYNYDLPADGTPALFPINMGDGSYAFRIMENIEGSSYAELDSAYADVKLESEFDPFLLPNVFCSYDDKSKCVSKAREVAGTATNQGEVVREVCTFVAKTVSYDFDKAEILAQSSGYVPDPDATLKEKKGVCFDYASLSAAMLRSLGLPTKVITGYVAPGDLYHAWIMVYVDGTWKTAQFSVTPKTWSRCDVTFASTGATDVTGDGTSYTDRYTY